MRSDTSNDPARHQCRPSRLVNHASGDFGTRQAIHEAPPDGQIVTVGADVVAWTRTTLRVFRDQLRAGTWSSCPCGEQHGQRDTDAAVLAAVNNDLLLLPTPGPDNTSG
jgi:hypothetical protein